MNLDFRQLEAIAGHLAKANPPPILYRYRRPSDWALKEIQLPHVHIASPADMNDPFEYAAPLHYELSELKEYARKFYTLSGMDKAEAIRKADGLNESSIAYLLQEIEGICKQSGLVCLSSNPRSNRMWAYYADCHRGICISYDCSFAPFAVARSVLYEDPTGSFNAIDAHADDVTRFADHVAIRKGAEWEFEQEYRVLIGPFKLGQTRTLPIRPESIIEIRLGVNIEPKFRQDVIASSATLANRPRIIQMECDQAKFQLIERII
ncbi:MAG: hypothetical protein RLZZ398_1981 [Verrucomicrobiota bacterium]|jgi:hypothetical protein